MDEEHEIRMSQYKSRSSSRPKLYETDFEEDGQWDQESSVQLYRHRKKSVILKTQMYISYLHF